MLNPQSIYYSEADKLLSVMTHETLVMQALDRPGRADFNSLPEPTQIPVICLQIIVEFKILLIIYCNFGSIFLFLFPL